VWRKSSYSGENGSCVEVAVAGQAAVRDSKDVTGPMLSFGIPAWTTFLSAIKSGRFDLG
jgi:hypothetical protein